MENFLNKKYLNLSVKTWLIVLAIVSFFVYAIVNHKKSNESFGNCGNRRNVPPKNLVELDPQIKKHKPQHHHPQHHHPQHHQPQHHQPQHHQPQHHQPQHHQQPDLFTWYQE